MKMTAIFSPCRTYRYELWRIWDETRPYIMFVGLNPSTADETKDDPTVRRCIGYARMWGAGALCMTNIFAYRATDPEVMKRWGEPVGPLNNSTLKRLAAGAVTVVAAWGSHGSHRCQGSIVRDMIPNLYCLGVTKSGHPLHPLYLRKDATLIKYN
jgi:hypothetical protein